MVIASIIRTNFAQCDTEDVLSKVLGKLGSMNERTAVLTHNGKYVGVLDTHNMIRTHLDVSKTKADSFLLRVPLIGHEEEILTTAGMLFEAGSDLLPVGELKNVVGVVDCLALLQLAAQLPEASKLSVSAVPLVKVSKIKKDDAVATAIDFMLKEGVDHVPVFNKGSFDGVLSSRDILQKYMLLAQQTIGSVKFTKERGSKGETEDKVAFPSLPVASFSTNQNMVQISSKASLREAVQLLQQKKVGALVVMDKNEYQGLLTMRGVLKVLNGLERGGRYVIEYRGVRDLALTDHQREAMTTIVEHEAQKLQQKIAGPFQVFVHLKEIGKDSKKKEYAVTVKVEYPGSTLSTTYEDWDLETAVHKCFNFNPQKSTQVARNLAKKKNVKR